MYKFHREFAELHRLAGSYGVKLCAGQQAVLLKLALYKPDCQACGVYRNIKVAQQIRYCADVILMTVGHHHTLDLILVFKHIGEIGYYNIDTRGFLIREGHTAVYQEHIAVIFIQGYVLSYLPETAERYYFKRLFISCAAVFSGGIASCFGGSCGSRALLRGLLCRRLFRCPFGIDRRFGFRRFLGGGLSVSSACSRTLTYILFFVCFIH